ncbi:hypothetical protein GCM10010286_61210 [Streptomyces toxytricini]|nr:hypothetical protein GCM10010286_61210 [Streptomyces toxytricini]
MDIALITGTRLSRRTPTASRSGSVQKQVGKFDDVRSDAARVPCQWLFGQLASSAYGLCQAVHDGDTG